MTTPMIYAGGPLLSRIRRKRLASAFELSEAEVLADAVSIVDWSGRARDLEALLNARHAWTSNQAFYFVWWVRLQVWCTCHGVPDRPPALPTGG